MNNSLKFLLQAFIALIITFCSQSLIAQTYLGYQGAIRSGSDAASFYYSPVYSTREEALEWMQAHVTQVRFGPNALPVANSLVFYYFSPTALGPNTPAEFWGDPTSYTSSWTTSLDTSCSPAGPTIPDNANKSWNWDHYVWGTLPSSFSTSIYFQVPKVCGDNTVFVRYFLLPLLYVTSSGVQSGKNTGPCPFCVGNPVNPGTGNKFQLETDYQGTGSLPLTFARYYNSATIPHGSIGRQWRHTYDRWINTNTVGSTNYATVQRADGRGLVFTKSGTAWNGDADINDRLTEQTNGSGVTTGWTYYVGTNDQTESYDANGRLTGIAARDGQQLTLAYNANSDLQSVTDSFGRSLTFTYDSNGNVLTMTDPAGGVYQYAYSGDNRLDAVTAPNTPARTYVYNESANTSSTDLPFALTGIVDENNARFATYKYDAYQRAISTEHAGTTSAFTANYTSQFASTAVTDPVGVQRNYSFSTILGVTCNTAISQPCGTAGCTGIKSETRTYDANANITERIDFNGNKTCFAFDTTRNLETARVEGLPSSAVCATALSGTPTLPARRIDTTWHTNYRLPATITEPTSVGSKVTTFNRDGNGNVLSKVVSVGGETRTWYWTYDGYGRVLTATDPRSNASINTYYANDASQGTKRGMLYTVTNAANHTTTITDYNGHGQPLSLTDANGLVTSLAYDARQRLTSRNVGGETTVYEYDYVGQLHKVTLPDASYLLYAYDNAHRLYEITDSLGNKVTYTLDNMGNRTAEAYKDPTGALARTRSRVYDALNRLQKNIGGANPATQITQYGYDDNGNPTSTIDPLSRTTTQSYDALNRLLQVIDPFNGGAAPTKYEYDAQDNLTKVTDPKNLATVYGYNGFNELVSQSSPDTGSTSFTYDAAGNLQSKTDARGVTAAYTYDALNRVSSISYPAFGSDPAETVTYTYDACTNGKGRLCSLADKTGTITYTYNSLGRITSKAQTVAGLTQTVSYGYNSAGQLNAVTYPSGAVIGYGYSNNRITSVTINGTPVLNQADYEPFGPVGEWLWGNSTAQAPNKHTRYFDLDGRNTKIESIAGLDPTVLVYDAASRITDLQKLTSGTVDTTKSFTFGYDTLDRLATVTPNASNPSSSRGYSYDGVGNRLSATVAGSVTNYSYGSTSHRLNALTGASSASYSYDAAGNRATDSAATWTYGGNNRPIQVAVGGNNTTFGINALGQRVRKSNVSGVTRFVYDEAGRLIGEYDTTGTRLTETVWFNDLPVAVLK